MRKVRLVALAMILAFFLSGCITADGQPMTQEEKWDLALDAADMGLDLMLLFQGTEYWDNVAPYHAIATSSVAAMKQARADGNKEAFDIAKEGFLAALADFLKWKKTT